MQLSKIKIKNYRLLIDAELEVDPRTTLIVGRNNTAKTSCFSCIGKVLDGETVSFDDYPLLRREDFYTKIALFMEKKLTYEDLCKQIKIISIEFLVDYSLDDPDDNLGALSPFIIDVDVDTTTALIRAEYRLKSDEKTLWTLLESSYYKDGAFSPSEDAHKVLADNFGKLFGLTVYAINPNNPDDKQVKSQKELHDLFPFHAIPAERVLGEDDAHNSSLGSLISSFFDMSEAELDPDVAEEIKRLRSIVEKTNKNVQKQSNEILSSVVNNSIGFGYPNIEELKLGVTTQLSIDDQIKNQTKLSYISGTANESLPSSHNGLGYKNLIKMEFLLAAFAKDIEKRGVACVPLLFIEEPESHMHPQMQTAFAAYLEKFLDRLSDVKIQTFLTSHSAHIANTMEFAKVRYAQKSNTGVIYKNLNTFAEANPDNVDFIRKYLTLTRCDLFFADKAIFVEGASNIMTPLEMEDYLDAAERLGHLPMFMLALMAGLRQGELIALKWSDLDIESRTLTIAEKRAVERRELVEYGSQTRSIRLTPEVVDLLIMEHSKHPSSPLMFMHPATLKPYSPQMVRRMHNEIIQEAGIDHIRYVDLRHTCAILALKNGTDAKELAQMLGHYRPTITRQNYEPYLQHKVQKDEDMPKEATQSELQQAANILDNLLKF